MWCSFTQTIAYAWKWNGEKGGEFSTWIVEVNRFSNLQFRLIRFPNKDIGQMALYQEKVSILMRPNSNHFTVTFLRYFATNQIYVNDTHLRAS